MTRHKFQATYILVRGGHAFEAMALAHRLTPHANNSFIVFKGDDLTKRRLPADAPVQEVTHTYQEVQRFGWRKLAWQSWKLLPSFWESIKALRALNADVVISTGSGPALVPMLAAKCIGIKVIFVESACRIYTPSLCGKIAYTYLADQFYIQWNEAKNVYPKAIYAGRLF